MIDALERVERARAAVMDPARPDAVARQHQRGRLTARERITRLCDAGSFVEVGSLVEPLRDTDLNRDVVAPADGIVTGIGKIGGRPASIAATDFTVLGGSNGEIGMEKLARAAERSRERGIPLILLQDGGGHRIQDGQDAAHFAIGYRFWAIQAELSGYVPMISAVLGEGFAAVTNFSACCDFTIMVRGLSSMGLAGPALVAAGTGEQNLTSQDLGGAEIQADTNGLADLAVDSEDEAFDAIRRYLSFLPDNVANSPPIEPCDDPLDRLAEVMDLVPANSRRAYDIRPVIDQIIDTDSGFELKPTHARNVVTTLALLGGRPVGIIANQPRHLAGTLDAKACEKAARFIALCDAFGLALIYLIDVPGFLVGPSAEATALGKRSARLLFELGCATVPRFSVVLRKGYGLAFCAMNGGRTSFDADLCVAWPTAEICAMSIEGAVDVAYRKTYQAADDPDGTRQQLIDDMRDSVTSRRAAHRFGIDEIIDPRHTRRVLTTSLEHLPIRRPDRRIPKIRAIPPI